MPQIDPKLKAAMAAIKNDADLTAAEKVELLRLTVQQWLQRNQDIVVN